MKKLSLIEIITCCAKFSLTTVSSHLVFSMTFSSSFLVVTKLDSLKEKEIATVNQTKGPWAHRSPEQP